MAQAEYTVVAKDDHFMIMLDGKAYGPVLSEKHAIIIAASSANLAARTNPDGARVQVGYPDGGVQTVWTAGVDMYPPFGKPP